MGFKLDSHRLMCLVGPLSISGTLVWDLSLGDPWESHPGGRAGFPHLGIDVQMCLFAVARMLRLTRQGLAASSGETARREKLLRIGVRGRRLWNSRVIKDLQPASISSSVPG